MAKVDYALLTPTHFGKLESIFVEKLFKRGKSKNTIKVFKRDLNTFRTFSKKTELNKKYKDFTVNHALLYLDFLTTSYNSPNTIRSKMQSIRLFWGYLKSRKIVSDNPFKKLIVAQKTLNEITPASQNEIEKIWNYFRSQEQTSNSPIRKITLARDKAIFLLILNGGMRTSEIESVSIRDIFTDVDRISITREKRETVTVLIPPLVMDFIGDYIDTCKDIPIKNDVLFFNAKKNAIIHESISARSVQKIFQTISNQLKINASPKYIRQACILNWIKNDVPDVTIKGRLGLALNYELDHYKKYPCDSYNLDFIE